MNKRVLLVEDEPGTQLLIRRMVQRVASAVNVTTVASAEQACRVLHQRNLAGEPIDLVIADLQLPEGDGLALWEHVQAVYPEVEFLCVSQTSFKNWDRKIADLRSFPPFMAKPVTEENLRNY